MLKKTGLILAGIVFFWVVMIFALVVVLNKTGKIESIIQEKISSGLPDSSQLHLGQINSNLLYKTSIDSTNLKIGNSIQISLKKIELKYKLLSYFSGNPEISEIKIINPKIVLLKKKAKQDSSKNINSKFNLEEAAVPFQKIFPENIHIKLQEVIAKIPKISIEKIKINDISIFNDNEELLSSAEAKLQISPGLINLVSFKGKLIKNVKVKDISFKCKYDATSFIINKFNYSTPNSYLNGKLDVDFSKKLNGLWIIDSLGINENGLKNYFPNSKKVFKKVNLSSVGYIYFYTDSIFFDISPSGRFNEIDIDSSKIAGKLGKTSLQIKKLKIWSKDGYLSGRMLTGFKLKTWLDLHFKNFKINKLSPSIDSSLINMDFKINFDKWDVNRLNGKLQIDVYNSYINNSTLKKITLNINANIGKYKIDTTSGAYFSEESVFKLSGYFTGKLNGEISLKFEDTNFNKLGEVIGLKKLKGFGTGYFKLSGNLLNPNLSSSLLLDSLGYGNIKCYGIEEEILINNVMGDREGIYYLDILAGNAGLLSLTDAIINLNIKGNQINIDSLTFYNFDNLLGLKGKINIDTSLTTLVFNTFEIMYEKIKMYNPRPILLSLKKDHLYFNDVFFKTTTGGNILANGYIGLSNSPSDFNLKVMDVNLKFLNQFEFMPYELSGVVNIEGKLQKKLENPDLFFKGSLSTINFDTTKLGNIFLDGVYKNNNLSLNSLNWKIKDSHFNMSASVNVDSFLNGKGKNNTSNIFFNFKNFELQSFKSLLGFNFPFSGKINSHMLIKNNLANLKAKGSVSLNNFKYEKFSVDSLFSQIDYQKGVVSFNDGLLTLYGTKFLFFAKSHLRYLQKEKKFLFLNEPLIAYMGGKAKNLEFLGDINQEVQNIDGDININVDIAGTPQKPLIKSGSISIVDGKIYLYKLANSIHIKKLNANFEDGILYVDLPKAYSKGETSNKNFINKFWQKVSSVFNFWKNKDEEGLISATGKVNLQELAKPKLDLDVKLNKAYINYFIENVEIIASTNNLKIKGQDTLSITGDLIVNQGDYKLDLEKYEKNLLLQSSVRETPPYLSLNLNLEIPSNFYLTQEEALNSFNFQIEGGLRIIKEPMGIVETSGILSVIEGDLAMYSKQIKVFSGKISFLNPKEFPDVEILSELIQNPYRFEISQKGKISNPELDIKIFPIEGGEEIDYDIKDKIAILITGLPFSEMNNLDIKEKGLEAITASALNYVQNKAKKYTGLDKIALGKTNRLNEGLSDEAYFSFGKYLSSNLYFEYKTGSMGAPGNFGAPKISWEPGNEIQLNYRLNSNWAFGTNYGLTLGGNRKIKFDFSWQFNF